MKHADSLVSIVGNGLCCGCGLCQSLAGDKALEMHVSPAGRMRPVIKQSLPESVEQQILSTCPGIVVQGPEAPAPQQDAVWGPAHRMARGHATDPDIRYMAASGGAISAISQYLLETHQVRFVLQVTTDQAKPLRAKPQISTSRTDILTGAGSWYGPVAPLQDVHALLDAGEPFAVVGKPCDIAAMRNLARQDPRVDQLVPYMLSFFCEGVPDDTMVTQLLDHHGLQAADVAQLRYRGLGCPGPTRVVSRDGRTFDLSYQQVWYGDFKWTMQFRCKICPDATGELADIAAGDVWDGGKPRSESPDGDNAIIARTAKGAQLLADMEVAGKVSLAPLGYRDLDRVQPHQVRRKRGLWGRLAAMVLRGAVRPTYRHVRLWQSARGGGVIFSLKNVIGTWRRLPAREPIEASSLQAGEQA
jgi:coenzyme F420 hydrogenase subunit beta